MALRTVFSDTDSQNQPLPEYPRPTMVRESYINLNGTWDYAITSSADIPKKYDGKIIVPFSPECERSGVNRQLKPKEYLWYHRTITDPRVDPTEHVLLQFGAIDQYARIYVNGHFVMSHTGGYLPFTADITKYLHKKQNSLTILVRDVSDSSYHSRGKQKLKRGGMFYTAQSGIWQTVFMECVPATYIQAVKITPNFDDKTVEVQLHIHKSKLLAYPKTSITIHLPPHNQTMYFNLEDRVVIPIPDAIAWTPENPHLYYATITCGNDQVNTYFAMRKISVEPDSSGILRLCLNNQPYFQNGLLDQGYWPESLYTPPSDEAMVYDITTAKKLGYNLLRKHAKIEPERWYYHCDKLGMLVWQDMVNGGSTYHTWFVTYFPTIFPKLATMVNDNNYYLSSRIHKKGREEYINEMRATINYLYNHPCIVMWVAFNEGWGQFHTKSITKKIKRYDPTRLVDSASGWFDQKCGDVRSLHIYFTPFKFRPQNRALILSEFGGYTLRIPKHTYCDSTYGYRHYDTKKALTKAITSTYEKKILPGISKGLSATVYTQVSDIEDEINGLMTYDRKVIKVDEPKIRTMNQKLYERFSSDTNKTKL
ncbi:MAG: glycoside hydrolase family 2 TIM barrel-domain containing protein [Clostridiales bacterium]|nr:glycoside hydrolase family 2 TIM barrel-domain containing protein [Clostridiales bacterium]